MKALELACYGIADDPERDPGSPESRSVSLVGGRHRELRQPAPSIAGAEQLMSAAEWERLRRLFRLTPSQVRIACLLCAGYSQAAMAEKTQLSINTVRAHLRGLFERVAAHDRVGVVVRLLSAGLVCG